jgi:hypothetical protein
MRSIVIGAVAALAFAAAASAAGTNVQGPYHVDTHGKCRAASGAVVPANFCHGPALYPYCEQGKSKQCGKTCIALDQVCHTP